MMRSLIWMGAVAIIVVASGAVAGQNRPHPARGMLTIMPQELPTRPAVHPSAVVDRVMWFDANGDDRIAPGELPERMQTLVVRGDKNQDGVLTSDEVVALVDRQPTVPRPPFVVRGPVSLADVIADLKLPPATHNRAMAIVKGPRNIYDPAVIDVDAEMRELLNDEDYENFVAAAARLRRAPRLIGGTVSGVVGGTVGGVVTTPGSSPR